MTTREWSRGAPVPLIIGHRGASAVETENTEAAFVAAREAGADGVELDVQRCATGELVVFHDDTVDRLCGRPGAIEHMSFADVRALVVKGGHRIPTLDEAFAAIGPDMLVNVEIKASRPYVALRFVDAVASRCAREGTRVVVSSFHPAAVLAARAAQPSLQVAMLFHRKQRRPMREAWPAMVIRPFAVHPEHVLVDDAHMRRWRSRGYAVNTWTVDDADETARLVRCGVDGIITNDPAATRRHVEAALEQG